MGNELNGIDMTAFYDELDKIAQERSTDSVWASKTTSAPRSKLPGSQAPKAPTAPGNLGPKVIRPAPQFGKRQNYSQPNVETQPTTNPSQAMDARQQPPPNVVFGVR